MNAALLEQIASVGSRLSKEALVQDMDEDTQRLVKLALDPNITFGITIDEDDARIFKSIAPLPEDEFWSQFEKFLELTSSRTLTGGAAEAAMWRVVQNAPSELDAKWAARIINRNLRAGFDIRTFNKMFGEDAVYKFAVQLALQYEGQELRGLWFFQPKFDGNRVVLIDGKAMSRNGKEYPNCDHVIDELTAWDPDFFQKWVVDGEMMGDLGFDQSSGALRRIHEKDRTKATFTYWAFDLIARDEWESRQTKILFYREIDLRNVIGPVGFNFIKVVPTEKVYDPTPAQIIEFAERFCALGFEGAMAKDSQRGYVFKKADAMLKVKLFSEDEFRIVGFYEGKGKDKGHLGGIFVEGDIEWAPPMSGQPLKKYHVKCKCGSGFDNLTRDLVWANQKDWMSAVVQLKFQEATAKGSLRFPIFIMRRKDKE